MASRESRKINKPRSYFLPGEGTLNDGAYSFQELRTGTRIGLETRLRWISCLAACRSIPFSILLGHSSQRTTELHYAPFVKTSQEALGAAVKMTR
jgi:hypothetical protein